MEILGEAARTARGLRTFMYVFEGERDWFVSVEIVRAAAAATTSTSTTSTLTFASTATAAVVVVVVAAVVAAALLLMVVVLAVPPPMTVPVVVLGLSVCVGVGGVAQAFWCTDALIPGIRRDGG